MGLITLAVLIAVELFFLIWQANSKNLLKQEKSVVRISEFAILLILLLTGLLEWGFRYTAITLVLLVQAAIAVIALIHRKEKAYKLSTVINRFVLTAVLYTFSLMLAIICPQYKQPDVSGNYHVSTAKYTWVDTGRTEQYSDSGEKRTLTVEFWYPDNADQKCPLVVFSHGAFGFSGSNHSTFEELASNGYIVASIGHTYQAFYTLDTNGKLTIVNTEFLNKAMELQNSHQPDEFAVTHSWLELRTADENFVLDTIIHKADTDSAESLFSKIDTKNIGLFGHSLGGASSAEVGRQRNDIKAVIVLDGTMIGEEVSEKSGVAVIDDTPYPIPLLNIYAEDHYTNAMKTAGESYANFYAAKHAVNASEIIIKGAGHLNFTDLPLFSPFLAKMLGVGTVDARYCINTANHIILNYFNCYLKGMEKPRFEKEY